MALTKKDLFEFGKLLKTELKQELTQELKQELRRELRQDITIALNQQRTDIVRDIRDEMDARFKASHQLMRNEMHTEIQGLRSEVLNVLTQNVMPAIDFVHQDLKREINEIRQFIHMPAT